jgi:tight adherence protein B
VTTLQQTLTVSLTLLCLGAGVYAFFLLWRARLTSHVDARLEHLVGEPRANANRLTTTGKWPDAVSLLPAFVLNRLYRAGIELSSDRLAAILVVGVFLWITLTIVLGFPVATMIVATILLLTSAMIDYRARRRMNALSDAMLGYFDRVRQLLVIGNSLSVALADAVQSSPPIVGEFFSPAIRRIANGAGVAESVSHLAEEIDLHEIRLFSAAVETNLRFGGSLTAILANLIDNIRRRAAVMREVRVSTSQIRASAWVLGLLPMIVASIVMVQSPEYARWFIDEPVGHQLLVYCAVSQILGAIMMRGIVRTSY